MIPTFSSRGRRGAAEAAYWRRHPPTSWKASQALLTTGVVIEAGAEISAVPQPVEDSAVQDSEVQATAVLPTPAQARQPQLSEDTRREWLMLLVWAAVVLIDAAMALRELAAPLAALLHEKAPWSRRQRRTHRAIRGSWQAQAAGLP
ncbi:hypothetical protein [Synechococcus sp. 1G10]|uniref:hypothetical protein n=1 Tax=Synechococcus sp. 1G10 TaxID=2025605 RepID=UPI000B9918B6|nr:hypothetical protein [Synechococcus sp. 1G10]